MTTAPPTQKQDRLKAHFDDHAPAEYNKRWDDLWSAGDFIPWDRGHANPALIDTLVERKDLLPSPINASGKRARALVPGCGKGYDIALFAAHGYDSYGLEVSENAVKVSEEYLRHPGEGPLEGEYRITDEKVGRGVMKCLLGNFFEHGWLEGTGGLGEGFDVIYDNTVSEHMNVKVSIVGPLANAADSSSAHCTPQFAHSGPNAWRGYLLPEACSSASNSPRISHRSPAVRLLLCHQSYTRSSSSGQERR